MGGEKAEAERKKRSMRKKDSFDEAKEIAQQAKTSTKKVQINGHLWTVPIIP